MPGFRGGTAVSVNSFTVDNTFKYSKEKVRSQQDLALRLVRVESTQATLLSSESSRTLHMTSALLIWNWTKSRLSSTV